jgi:NitT/TauT family transport system permease protein
MATGALARTPPSRWRALLPGRVGLFNVAILVGTLVIWEVSTEVFRIRPLLLPPPSAVFAEWIHFADLIIRNCLITLWEAIVGFGMAAVIGVGLAVVIIYSPLLRQVLLTSIVGVNATPKVALAPILIIWLGRGLESKYALAFLLSFFPIVINSVRGLADVPNDLLNLYRLMQASEFQIFRKVRMPNALPAMFDGFKIALPISLIGALVGEFAAAKQGIGFQMTIAGANFNSELIWAMIITIAAMALIMYRILVFIEDKLIFWRPSKQVY